MLYLHAMSLYYNEVDHVIQYYDYAHSTYTYKVLSVMPLQNMIIGYYMNEYDIYFMVLIKD